MSWISFPFLETTSFFFFFFISVWSCTPPLTCWSPLMPQLSVPGRPGGLWQTQDDYSWWYGGLAVEKQDDKSLARQWEGCLLTATNDESYSLCTCEVSHFQHNAVGSLTGYDVLKSKSEYQQKKELEKSEKKITEKNKALKISPEEIKFTVSYHSSVAEINTTNTIIQKKKTPLN